MGIGVESFVACNLHEFSNRPDLPQQPFTMTRTFPGDTIGSGALWLISTTSLPPYFLI